MTEWQPTGDETVAEHIYSDNVNRRHLTVDQRVAHAIEFLPIIRHSRQERQAATRFGAGGRSTVALNSSPPEGPAETPTRANQGIALNKGLRDGSVSPEDFAAVIQGTKPLRQVAACKKKTASKKPAVKIPSRPAVELMFMSSPDDDAAVGRKDSGKTTLRNKVLAPLVKYEDEMQEQAAVDYDDDEYEDDGENGDEGAKSTGRYAAKPPEPCVIVNDCTGPGVLRLLVTNRSQLLVNADELSTQFIHNTRGTDRQMRCELYDGHRRRQRRASSGGLSVTLTDPYGSILGDNLPDLLKCIFGSRGDNGFIDRLLLVGDRSTREAEWPRDADDPVLNAAGAATMERMVHME